ncbi:MAG: hypothetical protein ACOZAO_04200 [Patescibacteria group bacterium]
MSTTNRITTFIVFFISLFLASSQINTLNAQTTLKINAYKVVCDSESALPNWGDGGKPSVINETTAKDFINTHENCYFVENWAFQWGFHDKDQGITQGVDKLVGTHLGTASGTPSVCDYNCGVNTNSGNAFNEWKLFDTTTGPLGTPATVEITNLENSPGIWVREVLTADYIPYTYPNQGSTENDVTAELYCHQDIANFDNYDLVSPIFLGSTYNCIAFNVINEQPVDLCLNIEGVQEEIPESFYFDSEVEACLPIEDEKEEAVLTISKVNNASENNKETGDNVTYTIIVSLNEDSQEVKNVEVIDLPPEGFSYVLGSWTSSSDVRGDLKDEGITTEPTYSSPGVWQLGTMTPGETVTLTYVANISSSIDPGLYKDAAWSKGIVGLNNVFANADSGIFVGTTVNVVKPVSYSENVEVEKEVKEVVEEVLGASSQRLLPATGANTIWLASAILVFVFGVIMIGYSLVLKSKKLRAYLRLFSVLIVAGLIFVSGFSSNVYAAELIVRIEEPKSPTNDSTFDINFVALDINNRPVTIKCYGRNVSNSFVQLGSDQNLQAGGDSGNCSVGNDLITRTGDYEFYVKAFAESDEVSSSIVKVVYDDTRPGQPRSFSKSKLDSCKYEISFKTAKDGGDTTRVEVYRSSEKDFDADSESSIKNIDIGSDKKVKLEVERPECGKKYYFAVRAFDAAGNVSKVLVETVEETETTIVTIESSVNAGQGPIPVSGDVGFVLSSSTGSTNNGLELENGDLLGDSVESTEAVSDIVTNIPTNPDSDSDDTTNRLLFWVLVILVALGVLYDIYRKVAKK